MSGKNLKQGILGLTATLATQAATLAQFPVPTVELDEVVVLLVDEVVEVVVVLEVVVVVFVVEEVVELPPELF